MAVLQPIVWMAIGRVVVSSSGCLIRSIVLLRSIVHIFMSDNNVDMANFKGADQTARMHRLFCISFCYFFGHVADLLQA